MSRYSKHLNEAETNCDGSFDNDRAVVIERKGETDGSYKRGSLPTRTVFRAKFISVWESGKLGEVSDDIGDIYRWANRWGIRIVNEIEARHIC